MGKCIKFARFRDDGPVKRVCDHAFRAPERFLDFFLILQLQIARTEHAIWRFHGADDPCPDPVPHGERRRERFCRHTFSDNDGIWRIRGKRAEHIRRYSRADAFPQRIKYIGRERISERRANHIGRSELRLKVFCSRKTDGRDDEIDLRCARFVDGIKAASHCKHALERKARFLEPARHALHAAVHRKIQRRRT